MSSAWIHGMYCRAAGDGAADAGLERRQHRLQRAAGAVEHDAGAHVHDAHAELGRRVGLGLPGHAHPARKSSPGGVSSSTHLVAVRCRSSRPPRRETSAAGRGLGLHAARRRGCASRSRATARISRLASRGPALGDGRAGEVDHGVAPVERRARAPGRRAGPRRRPRRRARAARGPGRATARSPVAARARARRRAGADQARRAGDGDVHGRCGTEARRPGDQDARIRSASMAAKPIVACPACAAPAARASPATAAATAGATSRLKTDGMM